MASLPGVQKSDHVAPDPGDADILVLRIALVATSSPLPTGPTRLASVAVSSGPRGGTIEVRKLQTVDANLELKPGDLRRLAAIPEPGFGSGLAACAAALAMLACRHARRGGVR